MEYLAKLPFPDPLKKPLESLAAFCRASLPYSVIILIATTILLPKIPLFAVKGTFTYIRVDDFINLVVVLIWFFSLGWANSRFFKSTLHRTIFFYWFVGFVCVVSGILITQVVHPSLSLQHWVRRIEYMVFFFVGYAATRDMKWVMRYVVTMLVASFLSIVYGAGQVFFQWCAISTSNREFAKGTCIPLTKGARPNGTFAGHYDLAIYLGFLVPIIISLFFVLKKNWQKLLLLGMFAATMWMIVVTQARFPFAATSLTVILLLWLYGRRLLVLGFIVLTLAILVVFGKSLVTRMQTTVSVLLHDASKKQAVVLDKPIDQFIREVTTAGDRKELSNSAIPGQENLLDEDAYKLATKKQGVYTPDPALEANLSIGIRLNEEWPTALRAFYRNPLLGSGFASLGVLYDNQLGFATDNDYLRNLGESGIMGVASLTLIFVVLFRLIKWFLKQNKATSLSRTLVISFSAAIVGFFLNAVFIDVLEASKLAILFWLTLGILVAVIEHNEKTAATT